MSLTKTLKKTVGKRDEREVEIDNLIIAIGNNKTRTYPCPYLNLKTKLCTIYDNRYELNPMCLTIDQAKIMGNLPEGCLY